MNLQKPDLRRVEASTDAPLDPRLLEAIMAIRQGLLQVVDGLEVLARHERTSDVRRRDTEARKNPR